MRTSLILPLTLLAASAGMCAEDAVRSFDDGVFVSEADPVMRVRIDPVFKYLGSDQFILKEVASVDRHHWVKATNGEVQALIVIQFEGYLDGIDGRYRFSLPAEENIAGSNYRFSPEAVHLGDHDYIHNTWAFDNRANAIENPGAESDRTLTFLAKHGYRIEDALIMSRAVRAVGDDSRKEIILFYMEPLASSGHDIADFPDGGPVSQEYDRFSAEVVARGQAVFEVLPEQG